MGVTPVLVEPPAQAPSAPPSRRGTAEPLPPRARGAALGPLWQGKQHFIASQLRAVLPTKAPRGRAALSPYSPPGGFSSAGPWGFWGGSGSSAHPETGDSVTFTGDNKRTAPALVSDLDTDGI